MLILDLSGKCGISLLELPSEIAKLPSLEQLLLHNNSFKNNTRSFSMCSNECREKY
jgi:hypothetical protein